MALPRPRRRPTVVPTARVLRRQPITVVKPKPKPKPRVVKPKPVAPAPKPAAPTSTPGVVPTGPPGTPSIAAPSGVLQAPLTGGGTATRAGAREQYGFSLAEVNRRLRDLAFQYGGAPQVQQFAYDPGADPRGVGTDTSSMMAVSQNDPNSVVETLRRNLGLQNRGIGDAHESDNTFFSGLRLRDLNEAEAESQRNLAAQRTQYEQAVADLVSQLQGAQGSRNDAFNQINAQEAQDYAALLAQAQTAAAPDAAPAPAAAATAAPRPAAPKPKAPTAHPVVVPPGMVRLSNGQIVSRAMVNRVKARMR